MHWVGGYVIKYFQPKEKRDVCIKIKLILGIHCKLILSNLTLTSNHMWIIPNYWKIVKQ